MNKKTAGRPRLYDSTSEKVDAFRKRQEASGYLRKEVLVTTETWEQVTELAKLHGVSASDAASGLLANGLKAFEPHPAEIPMFSRKQRSDDTVSNVTSSNPIADFFEKRKISLQSAMQQKDSSE